jgi:Spy/CpxP family protein refolding chaperone
MLSRRTILGVVAVLGVGLVGSVAAVAYGHGGGGRHGVMKRVVTAMIDEALDQAQVTPEQRTSIHASRDRVFAALEEHRRTRHARLEEALALFEADSMDPARVAVYRRQHEAEHRRVADAIAQAISEVHGVLTPAQRTVVADWVRAHRWGPRG